MNTDSSDDGLFVGGSRGEAFATVFHTLEGCDFGLEGSGVLDPERFEDLSLSSCQLFESYLPTCRRMYCITARDTKLVNTTLRGTTGKYLLPSKRLLSSLDFLVVGGL